MLTYMLHVMESEKIIENIYIYFTGKNYCVYQRQNVMHEHVAFVSSESLHVQRQNLYEGLLDGDVGRVSILSLQVQQNLQDSLCPVASVGEQPQVWQGLLW